MLKAEKARGRGVGYVRVIRWDARGGETRIAAERHRATRGAWRVGDTDDGGTCTEVPAKPGTSMARDRWHGIGGRRRAVHCGA